MEVMVAITLLSLLMIYVYNIIDTSTESKTSVSDADQNFLQIETALNRFKLDFDQIYSPIYFSSFKTKRADSDAEDEESTSGTGEKFPLLNVNELLVPEIENTTKSTLIFFTSNNQRKFANSKQSNYAWVQYKLNDSPEAENREASLELIRYFNPLNPYARDFDWTETKPQTLLKNIKTLEFLFWDSTKKMFRDSIKDISKADKFAMQAIKIKISWIYKGEEVAIERVYRNLWPFFDPLNDKGKKTETSESDLNLENEQ